MADIDYTALFLEKKAQDDIERQMLIMELESDYLDMIEQSGAEFQSPDWFMIGNGLKEADEKTRFQAKEILKSFLQFSKESHSAKSFEDLVLLFTAAKSQNRLTKTMENEK